MVVIKASLVENWSLFFLFSYVDYLTGELKAKVLYIAEKEKRGAEGQVLCSVEALVSLYPESKEITKHNIIKSLKENYSYAASEADMDIESVEQTAHFGFD